MTPSRPKRRRLPTNDADTLVPFAISWWRRAFKLPGPKDRLQTREFRGVVKHIAAFQERPPDFEDPHTGKEQLGAYVLHPWQIHYQQGLSILGELPFAPRNVLDICSGPAAFALAAYRHGAENVVCLDQSPRALRAGAELCGYSGYAPQHRVWHGPAAPLPQGPFDCIILGHALGELFLTSKGSAEMTQFCEALAGFLMPGGHLILVEDSLPDVNKWFLALRDHLVDRGLSIRAPCLWQGACPARAARAPCYAQREMVKPPFVGEVQRAARINASSLKFSYLIFQRSSLPKLRRQSSDERFYRVISPPVETAIGPRVYLCGEDGGRDLGCRLQDTSDHRSQTFQKLQRGGLYRIEGALERHRHLDIAPQTSFSLASPPGRPLPEFNEPQSPDALGDRLDLKQEN